VLSAVEGLELVAPGLHAFVVPITVAILVALFWVQSRGTASVSVLFGPVTLAWFLVMALLGLVHAGDRLAIFSALNPLHATGFLASHGFGALPVVGSVFLAVTGAEALYADMGHFGRGPIRVAWLGLVFPALALNYLGQGGLVLAHPETADNPFFLMAPAWGLLPLVLIATAATIIASQAVISGAFSLTRQAVQLGLLPRLEIQHTSESQVGQVYLPRVNWALLAAVLVLVLAFRSSSGLASAYGIAVTGTMVVTSLLAFTVFRRAWGWPLVAVLAVLVPLLAIEALFLGANLGKLPDGGYVPLIIAGGVGLLMTTWVRGTATVNAKARAASVSIDALLAMLKKSHPARVPGTAVFLTSDADAAPAALIHNLKHNHVLHDRNVVVTVEVATTPRVGDADRVETERIGEHFWRMRLRFGYMETPNVPKALALARRDGLSFEMMSTSYFLNRRSFRITEASTMPGWQAALFVSMTKAASDASGFYRLPSNRVLELGQQLVV
jgi:KUP system potassium uptake protein